MDKPERKSYTKEELTAPDFLATRGFDVFERFAEYQTRLIERLRRATSALQSANIPYAVVGGNAVAAWVSSVDESAVRTTQDVDILLRRSDLEAAKTALNKVGFIYGHAAGLDFFKDGPDGKVREGVHIIFAGEKIYDKDPLPAPEISSAILSPKGYYVTGLESLVGMKLVSHRLKDRVHLQDLMSVGLLNRNWLDNFPPELSNRLRYLLENPEE